MIPGNVVELELLRIYQNTFDIRVHSTVEVQTMFKLHEMKAGTLV